MKINDIISYSPKASEIFFFDNNIWMYLFCPLGNYNKEKQKHYSNLLKGISSCRATIFINSMVVSEYANRYIKLDFQLWKEEQKKHDANYKTDFIGTPRYIQTVAEVKKTLKSILEICDKSSDNFTALEINNIFKHFDFVDFNDSYYIEFLLKTKWKLVSDDSDFLKYKDHDLEVLTLTK